MKLLTIIMSTCWVIQPIFLQNYQALRAQMVSRQIEARGITHKPTLEAMRKVERHRFVPIPQRARSYEDTPLPIGYGQTISQPFIVASMTQLLDPKPGDRVLEIGAGSGYQAAVLAEIVDTVYTIEIVKELGARTQRLMQELTYDNVHVIVGDGYEGLPDKAPFDAIIVTAAPEEIPPPLIEQLKEGGKMIIPVGKQSGIQRLTLVEKKDGTLVQTNVAEVRFVPFTRAN